MRLCGSNDQRASQGDLVTVSKETYVDIKAYTRNTQAVPIRIKTKPLFCTASQISSIHTPLCVVGTAQAQHQSNETLWGLYLQPWWVSAGKMGRVR